MTHSFDRGHQDKHFDASLDQIGRRGQVDLGARRGSGISERGLKMAKCGPRFFKKLSQVEGPMRVGSTEFGIPEAFRGRDMNF